MSWHMPTRSRSHWSRAPSRSRRCCPSRACLAGCTCFPICPQARDDAAAVHAEAEQGTEVLLPFWDGGCGVIFRRELPSRACQRWHMTDSECVVAGQHPATFHDEDFFRRNSRSEPNVPSTKLRAGSGGSLRIRIRPKRSERFERGRARSGEREACDEHSVRSE